MVEIPDQDFKLLSTDLLDDSFLTDPLTFDEKDSKESTFSTASVPTDPPISLLRTFSIMPMPPRDNPFPTERETPLPQVTDLSKPGGSKFSL